MAFENDAAQSSRLVAIYRYSMSLNEEASDTTMQINFSDSSVVHHRPCQRQYVIQQLFLQCS